MVDIFDCYTQNKRKEKKSLMNVGLITFHAAYNYGSVLQAFATQKAVCDLGNHCEIINYRFRGQKDFYRLIRLKYGLRITLSDLIQFPVFKKKIIREQKFEKFINECLVLSSEFSEPSELLESKLGYDIYLSGSDQIWSKYSSELYYEDWDYIDPYLLKFTKKKKIAYASSIGSMADTDLNKIKPWISKYKHIAMRERSMADKLSRYLGTSIEKVLDPTLLYQAEDYMNWFSLKLLQEKFILFYSLRGPKIVNKQRHDLIQLAKQTGLKIYAITPYCYFPNNNYYKNKIESGVEDFLQLIMNAKLIITDSFHGTALSIVFNKNFYSICRGWDTDYRKNDLLTDLGITNRSVSCISDCDITSKIDYKQVNEKLDILRMHSFDYLKNAINN